MRDLFQAIFGDPPGGAPVNRPRLFTGMLLLLVLALVVSLVAPDEASNRILNWIATILALCLFAFKSDLSNPRPPGQPPRNDEGQGRG